MKVGMGDSLGRGRSKSMEDGTLTADNVVILHWLQCYRG